MTVNRALGISGWMSPTELAFLAESASTKKRIVEIGSWAGRSAVAISSHTTGVLFCVDTWERALQHQAGGKIEPTLFAEFTRNTEGLPVIPVMTDSLTACQWMKNAGMSFDMIFIDADHDYDKAKADIVAWSQLLEDGGLLCGHDYGFPAWPGVKQAVDELLPKIEVTDTIWVAR